MLICSICKFCKMKSFTKSSLFTSVYTQQVISCLMIWGIIEYTWALVSFIWVRITVAISNIMKRNILVDMTGFQECTHGFCEQMKYTIIFCMYITVCMTLEWQWYHPGGGGVLSTKVYPGTCRWNGSQNQPPGIKMTPYSVQKLV